MMLYLIGNCLIFRSTTVWLMQSTMPWYVQRHTLLYTHIYIVYNYIYIFSHALTSGYAHTATHIYMASLGWTGLLANQPTFNDDIPLLKDQSVLEPVHTLYIWPVFFADGLYVTQTFGNAFLLLNVSSNLLTMENCRYRPHPCTDGPY